MRTRKYWLVPFVNEYALLVLQSLWLILPAYIANPTPVIFGGGTPIDFGKKFYDGQPILGSGKTWRGAFSGILAGTATAYFQGLIGESYDLSAQGFVPMTVTLGLLLGTGAILGDIIKSFFKRRLGFKSGQKWLLADQLDFVVGALVLASIVVSIGWKNILVLVVITPVLHRLTNIFAYKTGLKSVPW